MELNRPIIPVEEQFKIMADSAPVLIWIAGIDKLCYFFNAGWLKFTGRTLDEEYGNGWAEGVHPDDLQRCLDIYISHFDSRKEFKMEYRLKRHDGQYRWLLDIGVPRYTADGIFAGYIGSCMDIDELLESERVKNDFDSAESPISEQSLNEELATSNEELAASNEELQRAQGELAALNHSLEEKVGARTKALTESKAEAQRLNEELTAINEELAAVNEELITTNTELAENQQELKRTVKELILAKDQIEKKEKLFKSIAVNIPKSLIIVIGKDHRFITIEGDLMVKMGYDSSDYTGKHPAEVGPPERYEATKHLYDRVLAGEQFITERKGAKGEDFRVDFVPLKNDQDEIYAGLIIALDITDIKKAEERSAKLAAIVESSDDAIISKTLEGVITSWNQSAERLFGYKEADMIGQSILKLIPEDRQSEEPLIIARLKSGERVEHFETVRVTRDNNLVDVSLTISPVKDTQGNIIGISKIVRDISEKKRDELRKNDFIGMVSHELKTPLTTLSAVIQAAGIKLKNTPDSFLSAAMVTAGSQVKKMTKMINGFLNISRLESGKIVINKEQFNIDDLLEEMIRETELTTSIAIHFDACQPVSIYADRDKIASVVANLLSNAIKYAPNSKIIDIKCTTQEGMAVVSVKDYGMGVKRQDQEKLFERYYRVESNTTRHIAGFGIGLYLSAEIIHRHVGNIWVESEYGYGSTFYFSLPLSMV